MCKRIICICVLCLALIVLAGCKRETVKYYSTDEDAIIGEETIEESSMGTTDTLPDAFDESEELPIYVCGAVKNPGVYYLSESSLKSDALEMAGGLLDEAASDYVNLAETVTSGEKIYFPYKEEVGIGYGLVVHQGLDGGNDTRININNATKEELMTLPGIGESKADAIIKYREEYGPFQNIEDITNISGIKEGVYNNIKEHIVVN